MIIRWYEAVRQTNGSYKVTVQVANHKYSTGIYNVHLYYIQNDGSQIGVGGTQTNVTLSEPKADLAITGLNNATGSYDVVISNLVAPRGFKKSWFQPGQKRTAKMISSGIRQLSKLMETTR